MPVVHRNVVDSRSGCPGPAESSGVLRPQNPEPAVTLVSNVELSYNRDDFDETGFEAVMEYLSTGQVRASFECSSPSVYISLGDLLLSLCFGACAFFSNFVGVRPLWGGFRPCCQLPIGNISGTYSLRSNMLDKQAARN